MFSVIVPYRPDGSVREATWAWLRNRWKAMQDAELVVSMEPQGANAAQFNHPRAINRGAEQATQDVLIIADADTAFEPEWVREAVQRVRDGAPWVLPQRYEQLTEESSRRILKSWPTDPIADYETDWVGEGVSWSGLVVVPREGFDRVRGYDERWEYWGADDVAFACAMNTLWGEVQRLDGSALHLWHPRDSLDAQPQNQHDLMYRYLKADGKPEEMEAVRFG